MHNRYLMSKLYITSKYLIAATSGSAGNGGTCIDVNGGSTAQFVVLDGTTATCKFQEISVWRLCFLSLSLRFLGEGYIHSIFECGKKRLLIIMMLQKDS